MGISKKDHLECLTSFELEKASGISRAQIENYVKKSFINSVRVSDLPRSDRLWSLDQVWALRKITTLRHSKLSLDDIADITSRGLSATNSELEAECMIKIRESRRMLKSLAFSKRYKKDISPIGYNEEDPYLRYIPQRWMAIIPDKALKDASFRATEYTNPYANLLSVIDVVGWSAAECYGTIASRNTDEKGETLYYFIDLTSPPASSLVHRAIVDSGCYRELCEMPAGGCEGRECYSCALFGRHLNATEQLTWGILPQEVVQEREEANEAEAAKTAAGRSTNEFGDELPVEAHEEDGHNPCTNNEKTNEKASDSGLDNNDPYYANSDVDAPIIPVLKPQIMLRELNFPFKIAACVMPAGIYLCFQCDEKKQTGTLERFKGLVPFIEKQEYPDDDHSEANPKPTMSDIAQHAYETTSPDLGKSPFPDPLCIPYFVGDPKMEGWFKKIGQSELNNLILPVNTALEPEDGYCMTFSTLPTIEGNNPTRYELQVLVNAEKIAPPQR